MGPLLHDSMVTVRLSEPSVATIHSLCWEASNQIQGEDESLPNDGEGKTAVLRDSIIKMADEMDESDKDTIYEGSSGLAVVGVAMHRSGNMTETIATAAAHNQGQTTMGERRMSDEDSGVNWEVLERTEDQEPRNQDTEDVSTLHNVPHDQSNKQMLICTVNSTATRTLGTGEQPYRLKSKVRSHKSR